MGLHVPSGRQQLEIGLGSLRNVSLAHAREAAATHRQALGAGNHPMPAKTNEDRSFGAYADQYVAAHEASWRNAKHVAQWRMTLTKYAAPLRPLDVDKIGTEDVLGVLRPIWSTKPETASRLRGRIEVVLDAAKAAGKRAGENPARWRGHLDKLLARPNKLSRGHHAALPFKELPSFLNALRQSQAIAAQALEFVILTVARSGEVLGARPEEIDLQTAIWTVPAARMKAGREHRVPLSDRALEIAREMIEAHESSYLFPGALPDKPLSNMALEMVLRRMKVDNATVHGFRSTFRDWAGDMTSFPRELAEAALAHAVGDKAEQAYRRSDALEKRRLLMNAWAAACKPRVDNVLPLRTA
jgi:integrase